MFHSVKTFCKCQFYATLSINLRHMCERGLKQVIWQLNFDIVFRSQVIKLICWTSHHRSEEFLLLYILLFFVVKLLESLNFEPTVVVETELLHLLEELSSASVHFIIVLPQVFYLRLDHD